VITLLQIRLGGAALATATILATSLAACGDDGQARHTTYPMNVARYSLPIDQFGRVDSDLTAYALGTLVKPCMAQAGFTWPLPGPPSPGGKHTADFNAAGRRLFDVAIATRFGYHLDPRDAPDPAAIALNQRKLTSAERSRLRGCQRTAFRKLPPDNQISELTASLGSAAYETAKNDDGVHRAATKWRECLKPQGISDLPELPTMMPSESLAREFGFSDGPAIGMAGPKEIRIAVADAKCRLSSGYTKQFYGVEFDKELSIVDDSRNQLEAARRAILRHNREARSIVEHYRG
jgi:hypothetical protein